MSRYAFGDSSLAAERLKLLAEVFGESTRPFLLEAARPNPRLAVDLGCGPGHTTHLLAELLDAEHAVGLDNSEHFIRLAQRSATVRVAFVLHDVTVAPFPAEAAPAEAMYCRFLMTHLSDPRGALEKWAMQLAPAGRLLVEEVEAIRTDSAVFRQYLQIVQAMLAAQGNVLYVGPVLDRLGGTGGLRVRDSQVRTLPVARSLAARMFAMNIGNWKDSDFVRRNYPRRAVEELEAALLDLAAGRSGDRDVHWGLRQIVYERLC